MHTPACILVVDDQPQNVDILKTRLAVNGYEILTATSGEEALAIAATQPPDLILLDILMPGMDGLEVCRRLKGDASLPFIPVIMLTVKSESQDRIAGFEAGADDYLTKPLDQAVLVPRVESMLRLKALHDTVGDRVTQLETQVSQLQSWNQTLEKRLEDQAAELERIGELKQFLPRQLAELVVSSRGRELLRGHRQEVTILCFTLEGVAAFVETAELDLVLKVLGDYYRGLGQLMVEFEGNLDYCAGDRFMVVFNDPLPCSDPEARAVRMTVAMRQQFSTLHERWQRENCCLDFGVGIAKGNAILSLMRFEGRVDYAVVGAVRQLASRLGEQAQGGNILVSQSVWEVVEKQFHGKPVGNLPLTGQTHPVPIFQINEVKRLD